MLDRARNALAQLPANHPPVMLCVIDAEEEFDWHDDLARTNTATSTIAAQPIIHDRIFDRYGIVPTYCVDWPVASDPVSVATLRSLLEAERCEIGAHLHPWVCPPYEETVSIFNSYAGNLPADLEYRKLKNLTQVITDNFGQAPIIFKAGRYGVGQSTADSIAKLGYQIDTSIAPRTSYLTNGGPDFYAYDANPFWFTGDGKHLLELPATTGYCGQWRHHGDSLYPLLQTALARRLHLGGLAARSKLLERIRLTPEGCDAHALIKLVKTLHHDGCQIFSLTYHSPSLVPGHTPYVRTEADLARFFDTVEAILRYFTDSLGGVFMSLSELHRLLLKTQG